MASSLAWSRGSRLVGIWSTAYIAVRADEEFTFSDVVTIGAAGVYSAFVLTPTWSGRIHGNAVRVIVTSPYVQAVVIPVAIGAGASILIDKENGLDNYLGFITGGTVGERSPNYWNTDSNQSGYFNVPKNVDTVATKQAPRNISLLTRGILWWQSLGNTYVDGDDTH
tara:strand:+ start:46 stop:546 length:501 start_codon:yes stop_codon:yes gene_type:complete